MGGSFAFLARVLAIGLGILALVWQPNPAWVEHAYVNGAYPVWEHTAFALTHRLPWSLGDLAGLVGVVAIVWRIATFWRTGKKRRSLAALAFVALDVVAILGLYAIWFEAGWGWNYARAPIESRLQFDPARVTPAAAIALRTRAMAAINALAGPAHARATLPLDLVALRAAWLPVVQRGGDDWTPVTGAAKPTIANAFMEASGTSGFINPFTLNVALASDVLWFERPFSLAHEWSHVAAYAREDEANYLAILTCLRSPDPAVRYSGWLELFLYLPPKAHYVRRDFVPLVWADFAALRERNRHHINLKLARWSWRTYNVYLKSNHVASGIENYNQVTRLMLGIPVDRNGLPLAR